MNIQEKYQKIGELLWSIMPKEAKEIYFTGDLYPEQFLKVNGMEKHNIKVGMMDTREV